MSILAYFWSVLTDYLWKGERFGYCPKCGAEIWSDTHKVYHDTFCPCHYEGTEYDD